MDHVLNRRRSSFSLHSSGSNSPLRNTTTTLHEEEDLLLKCLRPLTRRILYSLLPSVAPYQEELEDDLAVLADFLSVHKVAEEQCPCRCPRRRRRTGGGVGYLYCIIDPLDRRHATVITSSLDAPSVNLLDMVCELVLRPTLLETLNTLRGLPPPHRCHRNEDSTRVRGYIPLMTLILAWLSSVFKSFPFLECVSPSSNRAERSRSIALLASQILYPLRKGETPLVQYLWELEILLRKASCMPSSSSSSVRLYRYHCIRFFMFYSMLEEVEEKEKASPNGLDSGLERIRRRLPDMMTHALKEEIDSFLQWTFLCKEERPHPSSEPHDSREEAYEGVVFLLLLLHSVTWLWSAEGQGLEGTTTNASVVLEALKTLFYYYNVSPLRAPPPSFRDPYPLSLAPPNKNFLFRYYNYKQTNQGPNLSFSSTTSPNTQETETLSLLLEVETQLLRALHTACQTAPGAVVECFFSTEDTVATSVVYFVSWYKCHASLYLSEMMTDACLHNFTVITRCLIELLSYQVRCAEAVSRELVQQQGDVSKPPLHFHSPSLSKAPQGSASTKESAMTLFFLLLDDLEFIHILQRTATKCSAHLHLTSGPLPAESISSLSLQLLQMLSRDYLGLITEPIPPSHGMATDPTKDGDDPTQRASCNNALVKNSFVLLNYFKRQHKNMIASVLNGISGENFAARLPQLQSQLTAAGTGADKERVENTIKRLETENSRVKERCLILLKELVELLLVPYDFYDGAVTPAATGDRTPPNKVTVEIVLFPTPVKRNSGSHFHSHTSSGYGGSGPHSDPRVCRSFSTGGEVVDNKIHQHYKTEGVDPSEGTTTSYSSRSPSSSTVITPHTGGPAPPPSLSVKLSLLEVLVETPHFLTTLQSQLQSVLVELDDPNPSRATARALSYPAVHALLSLLSSVAGYGLYYHNTTKDVPLYRNPNHLYNDIGDFRDHRYLYPQVYKALIAPLIQHLWWTQGKVFEALGREMVAQAQREGEEDTGPSPQEEEKVEKEVAHFSENIRKDPKALEELFDLSLLTTYQVMRHHYFFFVEEFSLCGVVGRNETFRSQITEVYSYLLNNLFLALDKTLLVSLYDQFAAASSKDVKPTPSHKEETPQNSPRRYSNKTRAKRLKSIVKYMNKFSQHQPLHGEEAEEIPIITASCARRNSSIMRNHSLS